MEIVSINEPSGVTAETILMGTYDGTLYAYRMKILDEGINMGGSSEKI